MTRLPSPIQDPPRSLFCSFKSVDLALSCLNTAGHPSPSARRSSPGVRARTRPGRDSPGRWRSAGAPGCPAAAFWKGALERRRGGAGLARRAGGSAWARRAASELQAAEPAAGCQGKPRTPPRPGPSSWLVPPPPAGRARWPVACDWAGRARATWSLGALDQLQRWRPGVGTAP